MKQLLFCLLAAKMAIAQTFEISEFFYLDGPDTVFLIEHEPEGFLEKQTGGGHNQMDPLDPPNQIVIQPLSQYQEINTGLFGINVSGMFDENTLPYEEGEPGVDWDPTTALQWGWLSDLAPSTLRFPSGSLSKFMHLLHDVETGELAQGYGYNLEEIVRYFDWTDDIMNCTTTLAEIETQNIIDDADEWIEWMDENMFTLFDNYITKWNLQQTLPEGTNYLNDFLRLVELIETENPGHTVNVIVCLNIVSEPAPECKAIIDYMLDNDIYNVTIAGIEMGNETYADFFCKTLGFEHFDNLEDDGVTPGDGSGNYWDYINGVDYADESAQDDLEEVLSEDMLEVDGGINIGHNYIKYFKGLQHFNCKVGLVAAPVEGAILIAREGSTCIDRLEWNQDLYRHYDDVITVPVVGTRKKFDAVIIHTYYGHTEWDQIATENLCLQYPEDACDPLSCSDEETQQWQYDEYDERLRAAFDGIIGIGDEDGNFKWMIKTGYTEAYEAYSDLLHFDESVANGGKELWVTEWNLAGNELVERTLVYLTGFTHGVLVMEWWLKNVKINYYNAFRNNFFTYSTVQNFAGGSADLLVPSDVPIELADEAVTYTGLDDTGSPYLDDKPFFKKKISYYAFELLSTINKNELMLLKSNTVKSSLNPNSPPTVFIDPEFTTLYIYFTNVKEESQCYRIDDQYFDDLFHAAVDFDEATLNYVDAAQVYSTTGLNILYPINDCYDLSNPYPIEIKTVLYDQENLAVCPISGTAEKISVPAHSFGYIEIPFTHGEPRLQNVPASICNVVPNPATDFISVDVTETIEQVIELNMEIYSSIGNLIQHVTSTSGELISIDHLQPGIYIINIRCSDERLFIKSFIKI